MRVDEQIVRYYIMGEQMVLEHMLATHGIMAQVVKLSKKFDAEFPMMKAPQGEPEEVEFNLDVCEPFSFHYRGGLSTRILKLTTNGFVDRIGLRKNVTSSTRPKRKRLSRLLRTY